MMMKIYDWNTLSDSERRELLMRPVESERQGFIDGILWPY